MGYFITHLSLSPHRHNPLLLLSDLHLPIPSYLLSQPRDPPSLFVPKPPPPLSRAAQRQPLLRRRFSAAKFWESTEKKLLLQVKDLTAVIAELKQEILKGVNLTVYEGEVHAIMDKNGSGKSTFAKVLVGHPDYQVTGGSVVFKGQDLLEMAADERSLAGLFVSFQLPIEIPGVSNINFFRMAYNAKREKLGLPKL